MFSIWRIWRGWKKNIENRDINKQRDCAEQWEWNLVKSDQRDKTNLMRKYLRINFTTQTPWNPQSREHIGCRHVRQSTTAAYTPTSYTIHSPSTFSNVYLKYLKIRARSFSPKNFCIYIFGVYSWLITLEITVMNRNRAPFNFLFSLRVVPWDRETISRRPKKSRRNR